MSPTDAQLQSSNDVVLLVRWMWRRRLPLFCAASIGAVLGVAVSFLATPIYRAEAVVAFAGEDASGALGRGAGDLSSIASLVGVNVGGGSEDAEELLALLQSRVLGRQFIAQERIEQTLLDTPHFKSVLGSLLGPEIAPEKRSRSAYRLFAEAVRVVELDRKTGLVRVAMQWPNPKIAADWTNRFIALADDNFRRQRLARHRARSKALQAQIDLASTAEVRLAAARLMEGELKVLMSASTRGDFALRVIDPATPPVAPIAIHIFAFSMRMDLASILRTAINELITVAAMVVVIEAIRGAAASIRVPPKQRLQGQLHAR